MSNTPLQITPRTILSLYRRLHHLSNLTPSPFRALSQSYIKQEFRSVRDKAKDGRNGVSEAQWREFVTQWENYEAQMRRDLQRRAKMAEEEAEEADTEPALQWEDLNAEQRQKLIEIERMLRRDQQ